PVYSNVTALPHETSPEAGRGARPDLPFARLGFADLRARLVEQLTAPVRWSEQCRNMIADLGGSGGAAGSSAGAGGSGPDNAGTVWGGWSAPAPGGTLAGRMRRSGRSVRVENCDGP